MDAFLDNPITIVAAIAALIFIASTARSGPPVDDGVRHGISDGHGHRAYYTDDPRKGGQIVYALTPYGRIDDPHEAYLIGLRILEGYAASKANDISVYLEEDL